MRYRISVLLIASMAFFVIEPAHAATSDHEIVPVAVRSGAVSNGGPARSVVFSDVVHVPDAGWVRVRFDRAKLGRAPANGQPTVVRMTSLLDGSVQRLDARRLDEWQFTSAYFNGPTVQIELITDPGAEVSEIVISGVYAGPVTDITPLSICGGVDDRELADDPRIGRIQPGICTAWIFNDINRCFLTAGHCAGGGLQVVQFNVPLSTKTGMLVHPGPEDQYAADVSSIQAVSGGIGNDWGYFGCFPNSETGLTPFEAQGDFFMLADIAPPVVDQDIRISGYGLVTDPTPAEWNNVLTTHAGPYDSLDGNTVRYQVDTSIGDSGSAVLDLSTDLVIGIHTHAGCTIGGGANAGTAIHHPSLQSALDDPQGVCAGPSPLEFVFPRGVPDVLDPAGAVVSLEIVAVKDESVARGSEMLHYAIGEGEVQDVPLTLVRAGSYEANFPPLTCGTEVQFYFSAETVGGTAVVDPISAPGLSYDAIAAVGFDQLFMDSFETDLGWTIEDSGPLVFGSWERGTPVTFGTVGSPTLDADGSGKCYVTGNAPEDSDVDGGSTTLVSPTLDASTGDPHIVYWRWYQNMFADVPSSNVLLVEISNDDGRSWVELETVGPRGPEVQGGWFEQSFRIADFLTPTSAMRVRFTASDPGFTIASLVEAAIDGVRVLGSADGLICDEPCPADLDGSGDVGFSDLLELLVQWGACDNDCSADLDGSGAVSFDDLLQLLVAWGPCE